MKNTLRLIFPALVLINFALAVSNLITTSRNNAMLESLVQQQLDLP